MFKHSKIGKDEKQDIFLAVGSVVVCLIVLAFYMVIEGHINGATQVFKNIPSFIIYSFEIIVVLLVAGIIITVLKSFKP